MKAPTIFKSMLRWIAMLGLAALAANCDLGNPTGGGTGGEGLTGIVVDANGAPVANAQVRLYPENTVPAKYAATESKTESPVPPHVQSTTTGADGSYKFATVPAGRYNIEASFHDGDSTWSVFVRDLAFIKTLHRGADTLLPAGSVVLHVRSASNLPLSGAQCYIVGSPWTGLTDTAGACVLSGVARGNYRIHVSGPGVSIVTDTLAVIPGLATDGGEVYLALNRQSVQIRPGQYEITDDDLIFRLLIRDDGTYYQEVRLTDTSIGVVERLLYQETGKLRLENGKVFKRDIVERYINADFQSVTPWVIPDDGPLDTTIIRNVTSTGFEIFSADGWTPWPRTGPGTLSAPAPQRLYTHPILGFSMNVADGWSAKLDTSISGTLYDAWMSKTGATGVNPVMAVYRAANDAPLGEFMDELAAAMVSQYEAVIIDKTSRIRGTTAVAELSYRMGTVDPTKSKLVMFQKGANVIIIHFIDAVSSFDANTDILFMDSSLVLP
jgi:hypothetical protein